MNYLLIIRVTRRKILKRHSLWCLLKPFSDVQWKNTGTDLI